MVKGPFFLHCTIPKDRNSFINFKVVLAGLTFVESGWKSLSNVSCDNSFFMRTNGIMKDIITSLPVLLLSFYVNADPCRSSLDL